MKRLVILPVALALAVLPAAAEPQRGTADHAKVVAPFLDSQTIGVAHVDLGRVDLKALLDHTAKAIKRDAGEVADEQKEAAEFKEKLTRAGVRDLYAVFTLGGIPRDPFFFVVPAGKSADVEEITRVLGHGLHGAAGERIGKAVVVGPKETLERLHDLRPVSYPEVAQGFAAVADSTAQAVVVFPRDLRRSVEETMPTLPPQVGGGSIKAVTQGFRWAAVGAKLGHEPSVRVVIKAKDTAAAKELDQLYGQILDALGQDPGLKQVVPNGLAGVRELLTPKVTGDRLTLALSEKDLTTFLLPVVAKTRASASRMQSSNNLKQMALACFAYLDVNKTFPAHANYNGEGKALLSWRVHILPYIEQNDLYKQFHLDEPWDSPHNKKLIARMPAVYRSPFAKVGPGKTTYVVPFGKDTMFPPGPKGLRIQDITDGTSNTIMIVEVDDAHAVTWTQPEDLHFNPKQPLKGLGNPKYGWFLAAFADGSVHAIALTVAPQDVHALMTPSGGEVIGNIP
jgi:hypothetical protein